MESRTTPIAPNILCQLLATLLLFGLLGGCERQKSSEIDRDAYSDHTPVNPDTNAAEIGNALGIEQAKPALDQHGKALLEVYAPPQLYSDGGVLVTLNGQVTLAEGVQLSQTLWRQTAGPQAQLLNPTRPQTHVIIPRVTNISDLEFALLAADTDGHVAEARSRVRVMPLATELESPLAKVVAQQSATISPAGKIIVTLSLPEPPDAPLTLYYSTQDGTAVAGRDYESSQGQVVFDNANSQAQIEIAALNSDAAIGDLYFHFHYAAEPNHVTGLSAYIVLRRDLTDTPSPPVDPRDPANSSSSNSSTSSSSSSSSSNSSSSSLSSSSASASSSSTSASSSSSSGLSLVIPENQHKRIAAGPSHSLAVTADGSVLAWGQNNYRQCQVPAGLENVVSVAAGYYHNLALRLDGKVFAWGARGSNFDDKNRGQTDVPQDLTDAVAIAAGPEYSMALHADGTVVSWGNGPTVPPGLSGVVAIAAGARHGLALKADGTVISWAANDNVGTQVPDGLTNVISIAAAGSKSFALRSDGSVIGWGDIYRTVQLPTQVTAISASYMHLLYATTAGEVRTIRTHYDQSSVNCYGCVSAPENAENVIELAAGQSFNIALKKDGSIDAWGRDDNGQLGSIARIPNVKNLAAKDAFGLAVTKDGSVLGFGTDMVGVGTATTGLLDIPPHVKDIRKVVIGAQSRSLPSSWFALALDQTGTVSVWGEGSRKIKLPDSNSHIVAIAAADWGHAVALTDSGSVEALGRSFTEFNDSFSSMTGIREINSNNMLMDTGEAISYHLSLTNGTWEKELLTTEVKTLASAPAGSVVDCAISVDDKIKCYGDAGVAYGLFELPEQVKSPTHIACGQFHCVVLQSNGQVLAWSSFGRIWWVVCGWQLYQSQKSRAQLPCTRRRSGSTDRLGSRGIWHGTHNSCPRRCNLHRRILPECTRGKP